jgi:ribosomal protein S27E
MTTEITRSDRQFWLDWMLSALSTGALLLWLHWQSEASCNPSTTPPFFAWLARCTKSWADSWMSIVRASLPPLATVTMSTSWTQQPPGDVNPDVEEETAITRWLAHRPGPRRLTWREPESRLVWFSCPDCGHRQPERVLVDQFVRPVRCRSCWRLHWQRVPS